MEKIRPYSRKAQFYETDQMGVIHHANYIHWFEEARIDYMDQVGYGYQLATDAGIDFALLSLSCTYKSMVRFGEIVEILVEVVELTPTRMTVEYLVRDSQKGEVRAIGESRHCFFDRHKQRPVSLKRALPDLLECFSRYCRLAPTS